MTERAEHVAEPVVQVVGGRFGYRGRVAVEADLTVDRGEVVALVGANGSGKTTLLKGVLGLAERLGGTVELFSEPVDQLDDRSRFGYLPQVHASAGPVPATVTEVVGSGRLATRGVLRRRTRTDREAVAEAIEAVGLGEHARRPIGDLSGGQQRRALLARALAGRPEVLFLDEPLAGVDRDSQDSIAVILDGLVADGATVVVVLHELGPLAPLITRVVVLSAGTVVADGPPSELLEALVPHDADPHPAALAAGRGLGLVR